LQYEPIERDPGAFQQFVPQDVITGLCERAFGTGTEAIVELPWGTYNNTYRVEIAEQRPVVLRIAPEPGRQFRTDLALMRNEYAAFPYFAPVAELLPRIHFVDFTHQLIGRDYLFESLLPGVPAPEGMERYPRPQWSGFFRNVGTVTRRIHDVAGSAFGPIAGPHHSRWSEALIAYFRTAAEDVRDADCDPADVLALADTVARFRDVFDEITEPRLLHGDGWTANFLVNPETADLPLTGICDWDRAEWGDPLADWAIQRALLRPGSERDTFWEGYGRSRSEATGIRQEIYRARQALGLRLDYIRSDNHDGIATTYKEIDVILTGLK
jgi:aminoglycoside phosphotransferase (APT) family kinase protein